jgi:hypothetical protein
MDLAHNLNVWGGGRLLAFSGIDGPTSFDHQLVCRTSFRGCGLDVKLPAGSVWGKCLGVMKTQVYTPEGRIRRRWTTADRWPHRRMFLWDSIFHAMGWRHVDLGIARDAAAALLDVQQPDGMVAHTHDGEFSSKLTQPPVIAMGAAMVDQFEPDDAWIAEIYPGMGRARMGCLVSARWAEQPKRRKAVGLGQTSGMHGQPRRSSPRAAPLRAPGSVPRCAGRPAIPPAARSPAAPGWRSG